MEWKTLAAQLFPEGYSINEKDSFLSGTGQIDGNTVTVIGTTYHAAIGMELALAQAKVILKTIEEFPQRPIIILIDTQGQMLRRREEMLGLNRAMVHLGKCLDLARRK